MLDDRNPLQVFFFFRAPGGPAGVDTRLYAEALVVEEGNFAFKVLDDIGAPLNLKTTSNADEVVKANKQILAGLKNVANESFAEQISAQGDAYDQSLSALKALIPLHESLRNGAPLNLSSLTTIISQLQTTAAMFSAPTK